MPIKHNTLSASVDKIRAAQWDEGHDLRDFTLDEIAEGDTNKAFTELMKSKLENLPTSPLTQPQILARSFLRC